MSEETVASFIRIDGLVAQVDVIKIYGREDRSQGVVVVRTRGRMEEEEVENKLT